MVSFRFTRCSMAARPHPAMFKGACSPSACASNAAAEAPPLCCSAARLGCPSHNLVGMRSSCCSSSQYFLYSTNKTLRCIGTPSGLAVERSTFLSQWARLTHSAGIDSLRRPRCLVSLASGAAISSEAPLVKELPKNFDFATEERLYNWWESEGFFEPNLEKDGKPFVISMPPPNVTGALHMGHAMFVALEDIMTRHWRMRGRPSLWVPGTDHAGIATQLVVEKSLKSEGLKRTDLSREEFTKRVWDWKHKYGGTITNQIRRLGASCDWEREHFTLDDKLSNAVVEAFFRLHEKGLIYRGSYMVNWSPNLQTAVSDLEVEYSEEVGTLFYFKYPIVDGNEEEFLPVATTRPETVLGDTAVAVHPLDDRYSKYVGKMALVPMSGRKIPIVADEYVDREFGTGALKITPGHDPNDYEIGQRLGLPIINIMNKDGTLNENAGNYSGLDRFAARQQLWADFEKQGIAIKKEPHHQRVPRSQRGGEIIEPIVSKQWFVRVEPLAQKGLQAVENGELRIIPERFEKIYNQWLTNIKDWCISRQLWWGHRIPVWYVRGVEGREEEYVVARSEGEAYAMARASYGEDVELEQDPDVLDTWFSSGLWPFSTLGWPDISDEDLQRFYPTTVLETGHDILFFWVSRMVMLGIEFTGKSPFSTVYLHGLVRDAQGRKMSKSLGNVIDPLESVQAYGADALRFTLATGTTPGQDVSLSMERLNANRGFTNKLWNAGKFILQNLPTSDRAAWNELIACKFNDESSLRSLPLPDRWVVTKLHLLIDAVTKSYEKYDFGEAGRSIYDFFWSDFADWYIEASKTRLYKNDDPAAASIAQRTLVYVFECILKLLHPFMPFVTEELWQGMPHEGRALIVASWPERGLPKDLHALQQFEELQLLIRAIRNARAEYSVEPGRRITAIIVASSDFPHYLLKPKDRDSIHSCQEASAALGMLQDERNVLAALSKLDLDSLRITPNIPDNADQAVQLVVTENLKAYLPLAGLVDIDKEVERLTKQANKLQSEYDGNIKRLSSSKFVDKAPPEIVQGVRDKVSEAEEKLQIVKQRLARLDSMALSSRS